MLLQGILSREMVACLSCGSFGNSPSKRPCNWPANAGGMIRRRSEKEFHINPVKGISVSLISSLTVNPAGGSESTYKLPELICLL